MNLDIQRVIRKQHETPRRREDIIGHILESEFQSKANGITLLQKHLIDETIKVLSSNDVSETYSPPRVTKDIADVGLGGGWSLDLTVANEKGEPWDFSKNDMQDRAMEKIKKRQADAHREIANVY